MKNNTFTKQEFFQRHAPDFNFELDADQLVKKALEIGYILRCGSGLFKYNAVTIGETA